MQLKTLWFIVLAGIVSVTASLIGGLMMYFEGLKMLEKQIEEGSRSDTQAVGWAASQVIVDTYLNAIKYGEMASRFSGLNSGEAISSWLKSRGLSDVVHSTFLEAGQLFGINPLTRERFQHMIWWEPLRDGSKEYVWCRHIPEINSSDCEDPCNMCWTVNPTTGAVVDNVYNFSDGEVFSELLDSYEGRLDNRGIYREWSVPGAWLSSDGNPYIYISVSVLFMRNDNPYLQDYRLMATCDFVVQDTWVRMLQTYATQSLLMIANIDEGVNSTILAGNFPESLMLPNCSFSEREIDRSVFHPCLRYIKDLPFYIQEVHHELNRTQNEHFKKISTRDGDYWINRFIVFEKSKHDLLATLNLIWFRGVETVDGQMTDALLRPLRRLSSAMIPLDVMDLDKASEIASVGYHLFQMSEVATVQHGFLRAIENLKEYKAFIPQALFEKEDITHDPLIYIRSPPLCPEGKASIAFTDIQSSTSIWEQCPEGMKKDLKLHNSLVRECITLNNGYEVKTIGDSFMVAFDTVFDACGFGLAVQIALYESDKWDARLHGINDCQHIPGRWKGLRVRIGIHTGPVEVEENQITGLSDYFGPTVNTAARLESAAVGGSISISSFVYDMLMSCPDQTITSSSIIFPISDSGDIILKGISEPQKVYLMVPSVIESRCPDVKRAAMQKHKRGHKPPIQAFTNETISFCSSHSSDNSVTLDPIARPQGANLHLTPTQSCTVVHVGMKTSYASKGICALTALNELLSSIFETSSRLDSTLVSVSATAVVLSWNTQKKCLQHMQQGVRFAGVLHHQLARGFCGWELNGNVCCGICTGDAKFGNCGSSRQRYVMVVGRCVEVAHSLAMLAEKLEAFVLSASSPGHSNVTQDSSLRNLYRPVSILHHSVTETSTIYQLRETSLKDYGKVATSEADQQWGWSKAYYSAFNNHDLEQIRLHSTSDSVLVKVLSLMKLQPEIPLSMPQINQIIDKRRSSLLSESNGVVTGLPIENNLISMN